MKIFGIVWICCAVLANVQGQGVDPETTTTEATTTTTAVPTTPTTTTVETTTAKPTTTAPPETTTKVTTTSRPAPAPPSPAPSIPDYPHNNGKWSVEDKNNVSCVALRGAFQITAVSPVSNETVTLSIPPLANASGSCEDPQSITLTWDSYLDQKQNTLTFFLEMNNATKGALGVNSAITNGKFGLQNITAVLYLNTTNATSEPVTKSLVDLATFQTPLKHSYSCLAEEVLKKSTGDFTLKIKEIQMEAYRLTPPGHREFSTAVQCAADDATDVVPIAVGAALAGLVVIVLIAYLIGRRRSRARGYQSV